MAKGKRDLGLQSLTSDNTTPTPTSQLQTTRDCMVSVGYMPLSREQFRYYVCPGGGQTWGMLPGARGGEKAQGTVSQDNQPARLPGPGRAQRSASDCQSSPYRKKPRDGGNSKMGPGRVSTAFRGSTHPILSQQACFTMGKPRQVKEQSCKVTKLLSAAAVI